MKYFYILLFVAHVSAISAQDCTIPNGDFELWADFTEQIDTSEPLPENTVMLPEGYFSLFRLFFSFVGEFFQVLTGAELEAFASEAFSVTQVTDASNGIFAAQIGGDENGPLADLIGVFACPLNVPDSFYIDVKHIGTGADTLYLQGAFGESSEVPLDSFALEQLSGAFFAHQLTSNEETEYETIAVPVINNNNNINSDTLVMLVLAFGDEAFFADGGESAFIIDNMRFNNSSILSLDDIELSGGFEADHNKLRISHDFDAATDVITIERSLEANGEYKHIGTLDTESDDSFRDYDIVENTVYYYRVKAENFDGQPVYSEILSIRTKELVSSVALAVVPNPMEDRGAIILDVEKELSDATCYIYDSRGQLVQTKVLPSRIDPGKNTFDLNVHDFSSGLYSCQIVSATEVWTTSFIVSF